MTKQAVISPDYPHQRINTDIKGTDIDTCACGPRHNIDLPPRHIWYRHWRLPTRQYNHQADKLFWTYHNRRYRYHGWHRCRSRCHRGPARWPKDLGLWHHPCFSCPCLCPHSSFHCCRNAEIISRIRQGRRWSPHFSRSVDDALWIPKISKTDRAWYANIATRLDMSVSTRVLGSVNGLKR